VLGGSGRRNGWRPAGGASLSRTRLTLVGLLAFLAALAALAVSAAACGIGGPGGGKEATTLATTLEGESKEGAEITVLEGAEVKDKATLSGKNASKATGKVKYDVYSDNKCEHLVTAAGEGAVSGESVSASSEESPEAGKAYYWQATYEGDSHNSASTSSCGGETLNVKASTSLSTTLSGGGEEGSDITILEGSKAKDKATISGTNSSTATGKVIYDVYPESGCKGTVKEAGEVTVTSGSVPTSNEMELEGGKAYYWQATYKGDGLHEESTSTCTEIASVKAETKLATTLSGESKEGEELTVLEGSKAKDKATISGVNSSTATGKVTYDMYPESGCKGTVKEAGEVTVTSGSIPASNEMELEGGASYYWQATYKGDGLHQESKSACGKEVLTVKAKTTLSTALSGEDRTGEELEVVEGAKTSDRATLSGAGVSMASGTIKYDIYSDPECEELLEEVDTVTVAGELAPSSSEVTLPVGTYYWRATYSGDAIDEGSTSACDSEIAEVTPAVTTSLSGEGQSGEGLEVLEGTGVKDEATLHGEHASKATGTVKYNVYSDSKCKELVKEAGEVTVTSGSIPASSEEALSPGTYYWQVSYSGDAENPAAKSVCGAEVVIVETATSLATSLSGEGKSGTEIDVKEGAAVKDAATLSGAHASEAGGYVAYHVYADSECKDLVAGAGDVSVSSGVVPDSEEETLPAGTYYWQAVYSGDGTNHSITSTCGAEIATVTAPVSTSLSGEGQSGAEVEVEEEAGVKDVATLHGEHASTATGTVKYDVYSDPECKELVKEAGEVTVTSGSVPASSEEKIGAGNYYWQASYSGDAENPAAKSACGTEVAIVKPPEGKYAALGDSFSAGVGAAPYYAKTNLAGAEDNKCHRSAKSYPARLAEALYSGSTATEEKEVFKRLPPKFIFRACDGAVAWNLWGGGFANGQYSEWIEGTPGEWLAIPAQDLWLGLPGGEPVEAPNKKITLVTLTIGGNDAGFATVGEKCANASRPTRYTPANCKEVITEWETGIAKMSGAGPPKGQAEGIPSLREKLPVVLANIHEWAPNARIRIPLYPQILNTARNGAIPLGVSNGIRFFIENGPPQSATPRAMDVGAALERFTERLNLTIAATVQEWARAEKVNAKVIPETITALNGHRLGNNEPWVNKLSLMFNLTTFRFEATTGSIHPTCRGYIAMAERILGFLGRAVPGGWTC
jgi:lysophospholipase L1-like esterase